MKGSLSKKIFAAVAAFYLLYVTLPIFGQLLPLSIQYVSVFVTVAIILTCPKAFFNKPTLWLVVYFGVLSVYLLFGKTLTISSISDEKGNMFKMLMEMAFILPAFSIMCVVYYFKDKKLIRFLFYTVIAGLTTSFLYLIPLTIADPNILRSAMHAEDLDIYVPGAPRYSLMHAYVIIAAPALYACMVQKGKSKYYFIAFFAMLTYMILRSYIATTIILFLGVLGAAFVKGTGAHSHTVMRVMLVAAVFIVFVGLGGLSSLYDSTYSFFEGSYAQGKMDQLGAVMSGRDVNDNSLSERQFLHTISWRCFLTNPITGYPKIGGHSNFLDRLGGMGLLCFIPYLMLLISIFQLFRNELINTPYTRYYYMIGVVIVFVLLYEKGLFSYEGWTFYSAVLPIASIYLSDYER